MPKVPFWVFILLALLHLSAFYIDTMDVDASQYAEMSREMLKSGSYLQLYDRGNEYLDKPPFLFWVSSLSMKLFGVNNFGYKLPSVLFAFWAMYATYRLCRLLYGENTGRIAALILGSCQGLFLMTNDIRTDTILMSWVVTAVWMLKEWDLNGKLSYLLAGAAAIACGMMTKGPIAVMIPVFCFVSDWVLKREWRKFFRPAYLLATLAIAVLLIPMSIGLYQQFDMHPEKTVNGLKNVSGLRFFYWSQSFGRITGESPWNNGAGFDFLMSSMLWAFLPWILLFLVSLIINMIQLVRQGFRLLKGQEWLTTGGFILGYIALGSSRYQLPHYIFVVFPLASIMTAKLLQDFYEKDMHKRLLAVFRPTQTIVSALLLIAVLLVLIIVFPAGMAGILLWLLAVAIWIIILLKSPKKSKMLYISLAGIMLANIFITHHFYRNLLKYQIGSQVGRYLAKNHIPGTKLGFVKMDDPLVAMHFYANELITNNGGKVEDDYILTTQAGIDSLKSQPVSYDIIKRGSYFKVSELTPDFLNNKTRYKAVKSYYLLQLK